MEFFKFSYYSIHSKNCDSRTQVCQQRVFIECNPNPYPLQGSSGFSHRLGDQRSNSSTEYKAFDHLYIAKQITISPGIKNVHCIRIKTLQLSGKMPSPIASQRKFNVSVIRMKTTKMEFIMRQNLCIIIIKCAKQTPLSLTIPPGSLTVNISAYKTFLKKKF